MLTALLLLACRPPLSAQDVTVTVSEDISTVVTVSWDTDEATSGWVEHGPDDRYGLRTPATGRGTAHRVQVLGLRADTTHHLRVVTDDGPLSGDLTVTTGPLPTALPALTVEGDPGAWGGFVPTPLIGALSAALILDSAGEVVWYWLLPAEDGFEDQGARRVAIAPSGSGVFVNQIGTGGSARIHHVSWDGSAVRTLAVTDHNHDLVPSDDDSVVALRYDTVELDDGSLLTGDRLSHISADGEVTDLWSVHDDLTPQRDPPPTGSWTHANALDVADGGDTFYVGLRKLSTIARLTDGGTRLDWMLGDPRYGFSDFSFPDGSTAFDGQHQFELLSEDRLLVFDNNPSGGASRVVEYQLYLDDRVAEQVWSHDLGEDVYALGDVARLDGGATFLNLSVLGALSLIDDSGAQQWRASTPLGYAFGYGTPVATLYSE